MGSLLTNQYFMECHWWDLIIGQQFAPPERCPASPSNHPDGNWAFCCDPIPFCSRGFGVAFEILGTVPKHLKKQGIWSIIRDHNLGLSNSHAAVNSLGVLTGLGLAFERHSLGGADEWRKHMSANMTYCRWWSHYYPDTPMGLGDLPRFNHKHEWNIGKYTGPIDRVSWILCWGFRFLKRWLTVGKQSIWMFMMWSL